MDTADDARPPAGVPGPGDEGAWDAGDVWRERVRGARDGRPPSKVRKAEPASEGWDPVQTWRDRVLKPRNR